MFDYSIIDLKAEKAARQGSKALNLVRMWPRPLGLALAPFWATSVEREELHMLEGEGEPQK